MTKRKIENQILKDANAVLPDSSFKQRVTESVSVPAKPVKSNRKRGTFEMPRQAIRGFVATCLVVCICLGTGFGLYVAKHMKDGADTPTTEPIIAEATYVSVDINPSFGIAVDEDGAVIEIEALNEDGAVVLLGTDLVGQKIEDVLDVIIDVSVELGYLGEDGDVSVIACNDNQSLQDAINAIIQNEIDTNDTLNTLNITVNIDLGGKEAILSALEQAGKIVGDVADYTAEQLNELLKDYDEEAIEQYVLDVTAQFEEECGAFVEDMRIIAGDVVSAYEKGDVISMMHALGDACEYLVSFLESKGVETSIEDAVTSILQHPEYVEEFCSHLEMFLQDNFDEEFVASIESYVKAQIKAQQGQN